MDEGRQLLISRGGLINRGNVGGPFGCPYTLGRHMWGKSWLRARAPPPIPATHLCVGPRGWVFRGWWRRLGLGFGGTVAPLFSDHCPCPALWLGKQPRGGAPGPGFHRRQSRAFSSTLGPHRPGVSSGPTQESHRRGPAQKGQVAIQEAICLSPPASARLGRAAR